MPSRTNQPNHPVRDEPEPCDELRDGDYESAQDAWERLDERQRWLAQRRAQRRFDNLLEPDGQ